VVLSILVTSYPVYHGLQQNFQISGIQLDTDRITSSLKAACMHNAYPVKDDVWSRVVPDADFEAGFRTIR